MPGTPGTSGALKVKVRPNSKLTQRLKGDNFAEKLEKLLSPEGLVEFTTQGKDNDSDTPSENASSPAKKKNTEDKLSQSLRKRGTVKPTDKETKTNRFLERLKVTGPDRQKFKEIETLIESQEKEKSRLQKENEMLREVALIAQQTSIINENRFLDEIRSLEGKLQNAVMSRINDSEKMNTLRLHNRKIQDEIANMRGVAERQAQVEKDNLVRAFQKQIELKAAELEEERRSGQNTTGEWVSKNQELQEQINNVLHSTETKHVTNRALIEQNKVLTVEYKAQADDEKYLKRQLDAVRSQNASLKERIHELEAQMTELSKPASAGDTAKRDPQGVALSNSIDGRPQSTRASKFEEALDRVKKLSEIERRNLNQVKAAQAHTLSLRTELEVVLRETINVVQDDVMERAKMAGTTMTETSKGKMSPTEAQGKDPRVTLAEFTAADRRRVIEIMLSKERVLHLLYVDDPPEEAAQSSGFADPDPEDPTSYSRLFSEQTAAMLPRTPPAAVPAYSKWRKGTEAPADGGSFQRPMIEM